MEVQLVLLPQRRPLQPKNIQWDPKPKRRPMGVMVPMEASLAEELRLVRRRRERLKLEREKTERVMEERERVLERGLREMERRWEEQMKVELEIQRIVWITELSSCVRVSPMLSLRAQEEEKRDAQLKEANSSERNEVDEPSKKEKDVEN